MVYIPGIDNPPEIQNIVDTDAKIIRMEMLKEMAIFVQVVDCGGFSKAARQLGVTTSAVSRHVTRLEAHMGGRLLHRTTRSLALTELGAQVHAGSLRMIAAGREVHALAGSYSARPNGVIRVTAPIVFGQLWLAPRLPAFLDQYPEVGVRLTLVDRTVDLIEEREDLAIRIARELPPGHCVRSATSWSPPPPTSRGTERPPRRTICRSIIAFAFAMPSSTRRGHCSRKTIRCRSPFLPGCQSTTALRSCRSWRRAAALGW
jgi:DNA-binding transcriptional LysR family regulator